MIGFILSLLGILALCAIAFVFGAVMCLLGAYYKIKEAKGTYIANRFLDFMK